MACISSNRSEHYETITCSAPYSALRLSPRQLSIMPLFHGKFGSMPCILISVPFLLRAQWRISDCIFMHTNEHTSLLNYLNFIQTCTERKYIFLNVQNSSHITCFHVWSVGQPLPPIIIYNSKDGNVYSLFHLNFVVGVSICQCYSDQVWKALGILQRLCTRSDCNAREIPAVVPGKSVSKLACGQVQHPYIDALPKMSFCAPALLMIALPMVLPRVLPTWYFQQQCLYNNYTTVYTYIMQCIVYI